MHLRTIHFLSAPKSSVQNTIDLHITPHMLRYTFATSLLDADVDIRYIQEMLGHTSINITEFYTHIALPKQRDILTSKHPRNDFNILQKQTAI